MPPKLPSKEEEGLNPPKPPPRTLPMMASMSFPVGESAAEQVAP